MLTRLKYLIVTLFMILPGIAASQGVNISFGTGDHDGNLPVQISSENLAIDQDGGAAVFTGNVVVTQGDLELTAPRVMVLYFEDNSGIQRMEATGGVKLASGEDTAESERADYFVETGFLEMLGEVSLVQKKSTLASEKMIVDTNTNTAQMIGRVRTVFK